MEILCKSCQRSVYLNKHIRYCSCCGHKYEADIEKLSARDMDRVRYRSNLFTILLVIIAFVNLGGFTIFAFYILSPQHPGIGGLGFITMLLITGEVLLASWIIEKYFCRRKFPELYEAEIISG